MIVACLRLSGLPLCRRLIDVFCTIHLHFRFHFHRVLFSGTSYV